MNNTVHNTKSKKVIEKSSFGYVNGEEIFLLKLVNECGNELIVSNYGAAAVSLKVPNREGTLTDVLLGYDTLEKYIHDTVYLGTVVGRCANRIGGPSVQIDGKTYVLPLREGGYHAHGGVTAFNKKVFEYTLDDEHQKVSFNYKSSHLEEGYPGNLDFTVSYTWDNENRWTVEYAASTDQTTILNPTQHAYFNLSGNPEKTINNHFLKINAYEYLPVNEMILPTGKFEHVENTPFDFRQSTKIGDRINDKHEQMTKACGYDHGWVLKKEHSPELVNAASVFENETGIQLDLYTTEPDLHFYAGNWLDKSIIGKENKVYNKRNGFCLETQHFPDAPHKQHFPSIVLKAGETFYSKTIFAFSKK